MENIVYRVNLSANFQIYMTKCEVLGEEPPFLKPNPDISRAGCIINRKF